MQESTIQDKKLMLSQLMDGEWHELNPSECVASLCDDDQLRSDWVRYHIIRDAMHNEPVRADQSLASRISDAIDDEPAYSNVKLFNSASMSSRQSRASQSESVDSIGAIEQNVPAKRKSWVNTSVAGLALAASVALVTVVSMNMLNQQQSPEGSTVAEVVGTELNKSIADNNSSLNALGAFESGDRSVLPTVEFVSNTGANSLAPAAPETVAEEEQVD